MHNEFHQLTLDQATKLVGLLGRFAADSTKRWVGNYPGREEEFLAFVEASVGYLTPNAETDRIFVWLNLDDGQKVEEVLADHDLLLKQMIGFTTLRDIKYSEWLEDSQKRLAKIKSEHIGEYLQLFLKHEYQRRPEHFGLQLHRFARQEMKKLDWKAAYYPAFPGAHEYWDRQAKDEAGQIIVGTLPVNEDLGIELRVTIHLYEQGLVDQADLKPTDT